MDHYIVSARKYRPSTFSTVIGQKPLTAALKHAIATDRLAHAYLFCGSRGVGKTSCARIFAKTINCSNRTPEGEACNECESCQAFNLGNSMNIIELDAASHNGIDDIKALIEQVQVPPTQGRYRVFIIDEVHMLTAAAFNAFLKTLEEPPEYVVFVLATTEKHKIIPTILSRCQIYDFSRITIQDMIEHLAMVASNEGIQAETSALNVIARKADGAMRDALSIFDQVAASTMGNVTYPNTIENLNILDNTYYSRLVEAFLTGDVPTAMLIYKEVREKGFDSQFFINGLGLYMRDLMLSFTPSTLALVETSDDERAALAAIAAKCTPQFIYAAMDLCNQADLNFRVATNKQFLIELTLVKLCQITGVAPKVADAPAAPLRPVTPAPQQPAAPSQPAQPAPQPAYQAPTPRPIQQQYAPQQASPVAQPSARVPAQQPATARRSMRTPSLNGNKPAPEATAADDDKPHPATPAQTEAYTDRELDKAWDDFIAAHPTERILISTMMSSRPQRSDDDRLTIGVGDTIQMQEIAQFMPELTDFLRRELRNGRITVNAVVMEKERSPITWTQREVLQHLIEKKPALKDFISDFTLSLS